MIYTDLSNKDYHDSVRLSRSKLMTLKRSPSHFYHAYIADNRVTKNSTDEMILGSLVHSMILEPEKLKTLYQILPPLDKRNKEDKELFNSISEETKEKGIQLVSNEIMGTALKMVENIKKNQQVTDIIEGCNYENSIYFDEIRSGIECKARPDGYCHNYVFDLKTCNDASKECFSRSIADYGYHIQCAMIQMALFQETGKMIKDFFFLCVEKKPPYHTAIYMLDEESILKGLEEFEDLCEIYKECKEKDSWLGYKPSLVGLPKWYK